MLVVPSPLKRQLRVKADSSLVRLASVRFDAVQHFSMAKKTQQLFAEVLSACVQIKVGSRINYANRVTAMLSCDFRNAERLICSGCN